MHFGSGLRRRAVVARRACVDELRIARHIRRIDPKVTEQPACGLLQDVEHGSVDEEGNRRALADCPGEVRNGGDDCHHEHEQHIERHPHLAHSQRGVLCYAQAEALHGHADEVGLNDGDESDRLAHDGGGEDEYLRGVIGDGVPALDDDLSEEEEARHRRVDYADIDARDVRHGEPEGVIGTDADVGNHAERDAEMRYGDPDDEQSEFFEEQHHSGQGLRGYLSLS